MINEMFWFGLMYVSVLEVAFLKANTTAITLTLNTSSSPLCSHTGRRLQVLHEQSIRHPVA